MNRIAGYLVVGFVLTLAPMTWAEDSKDSAKTHFEKGVLLFKNSDFDGALVEFKAAYTIQPHFAVRYNIGITLFKLQRYIDAHRELSAYIEEGGDQIPPDRKSEVSEIMVELKSLLGTLNVTTSVQGAILEVDGQVAEEWTLKLEVGEHLVEIQAEGHHPYSAVIELPGGEVVNVHADLVVLEQQEQASGPDAPPPQEASKKKLGQAPFWIGLGATVALGASAAVTGGLVINQDRKYADLTYEDESWESARSKGKKLALTTDILLGLTGACVVTTLVLAIFTDFKGEEGRQDVSIFAAPGSLGIAGSF